MDIPRAHRVAGALIGSAVGDALGAPFESGPAGRFSARFPAPARGVSALTHGDPAAGEGCAVFAELIRVALDGGDPLAAIPGALAAVSDEHRDRWAAVLAPDWTPDRATESNRAVWPTLGQAVWA